MPWTKRADVTAADVLAFEEMLDSIAEADRRNRLREAYRLPTFDPEPASQPQPWSAHHD